MAGYFFFKGIASSRAVKRAIEMIKSLLGIDQEHVSSIGSARQKGAIRISEERQLSIREQRRAPRLGKSQE